VAIIIGFPPCKEQHLEYYTENTDLRNLLRETPACKVRDRWAAIKHRRDELVHHHMDNADVEPKPVFVPEERGFGRILDIVGVWFCRKFHRVPTYQKGDTYSQCGWCERKYAVPWAFPTNKDILPIFPMHFDPNVYVNSEPVPIPLVPTQQAC
jgi:hypothetical protein